MSAGPEEVEDKKTKRLAALAAELSPVSMDDADFRFRGILYGDFGQGKTDLGCKIANILCDRFLLVYADSAWTTVLKYPHIASKMDKIPFGGLSQIDTILDAHAAGIEPYCHYNGLLWDTASTSADTVLRNYVKVKGNSSKMEVSRRGLEEYDHYRWLELGFRELIPKLRDSDLHIVYTAHKRDPKQKDIEEGKTAIRPAFPEATFNVLARESNMVGYVYATKNLQFKIQLNGTDEVRAKCQIPGIEQKTYDCNEIPNLLDKWINKERTA